jgi:hypothetical protein
MSNKLDKLFKEKLEGDSLQPSAQAWEKAEAYLGKKNRMVLWARVAAAVAVMGLLVFAALSWSNRYEKPKQEIVKEEIKKQEPEEVPAPEKPTAEKKGQPKQIKKQNAQPQIITPVAEQPTEQIAVVPEPEVIPGVKPTLEKGITLTYSLPPIKKQEAPAEPVVAEQKKSGFERVIEIAKEVRTGEAIGELRQAKDDIFALDFRKDKDKKKQ